jgi:hypothetical protein
MRNFFVLEIIWQKALFLLKNHFLEDCLFHLDLKAHNYINYHFLHYLKKGLHINYSFIAINPLLIIPQILVGQFEIKNLDSIFTI